MKKNPFEALGSTSRLDVFQAIAGDIDKMIAKVPYRATRTLLAASQVLAMAKGGRPVDVASVTSGVDETFGVFHGLAELLHERDSAIAVHDAALREMAKRPSSSFQPGDGTDGRSTVVDASIVTLVHPDGSQEDWRADVTRGAHPCNSSTFPPSYVRLRQFVNGKLRETAVYELFSHTREAADVLDDGDATVCLTPALHASAVVVWVCCAVALVMGAVAVAVATWGWA